MSEAESGPLNDGLGSLKETESLGIWLVLADDFDHDFPVLCLRVLLQNLTGFDERQIAVQLRLKNGLMSDCVGPVQVIGHSQYDTARRVYADDVNDADIINSHAGSSLGHCSLVRVRC